jgi:hypothetical protein
MADCSPAEFDERLLRARVQLVMHQPFLASAVMRMPIRMAREAIWCPPMCTDGYDVFYNPDWTATLDHQELCGVIAHEVLHVVFAHNDWLRCHACTARRHRLRAGVRLGRGPQTSRPAGADLCHRRLWIILAGIARLAGDPAAERRTSQGATRGGGEDALDPC